MLDLEGCALRAIMAARRSSPMSNMIGHEESMPEKREPVVEEVNIKPKERNFAFHHE
jgi:hypothetical protein